MRTLVALGLSAFVLISKAQQPSIYVPRNMQKAYEKGTRSTDGKPGKNYWQNTAHYDINVTVAPPDRNVKGSELIRYFNNSPDTLNSIVIRLTLNAHKPGAARNRFVSADYLTAGMQIDAFSVNGKTEKWSERPSLNTWQQVRLSKPLVPHDSVQLSFDWHYEASLKSGREGMIDSTTFYLAYFYPRVSVYDDYYGWDRIEFTDMQEFYSDFNDYTLTVNAPKNYIVWATGDLQNPDEVLSADAAKKLKASLTSDDVISIATKQDIDNKTVTAQNAMNAWKFKASNIPDVAVNVSDHYVWDAASVVVDDATKRRAGVQAAYNNTAKDFHYMVNFGRHALDWLSHYWPGVPYPYSKTTIVQGFADMEYPMMVNDGTNEDTVFSRFVAEHEIAHTWFPFYMGINESRYPFMDEGWATTLELLIGREDLGKERAEMFFKQFRVQPWIYDQVGEEDIPIITPGNALTGAGYGNNAYGKPALGYLAMKDLLGDELFKKCLHAYMDRWNGKHPAPWDFFYAFNDVSGQDLNWFWNSWYFQPNYIDFAITGVEKSKGGYNILIENIGGYPAPVDAIIVYDDNSTDTLHQTPALWKTNQKAATIEVKTKKKISSVKLEGGIFMDANTKNNGWHQ